MRLSRGGGFTKLQRGPKCWHTAQVRFNVLRVSAAKSKGNKSFAKFWIHSSWYQRNKRNKNLSPQKSPMSRNALSIHTSIYHTLAFYGCCAGFKKNNVGFTTWSTFSRGSVFLFPHSCNHLPRPPHISLSYRTISSIFINTPNGPWFGLGLWLSFATFSGVLFLSCFFLINGYFFLVYPGFFLLCMENKHTFFSQV